MENALEHIGPVDGSSLINGGIDAHDGRKIHDGAISDALPDIEEKKNPGPVPGRGVKGNLFAPQGCHQPVDETYVGGKDVE